MTPHHDASDFNPILVKQPDPLSPARVRYIKLGVGGGWERECLEKGIIRIGFDSARKDRFLSCKKNDWVKLSESFIREGKSKGTASRFKNELRLFFEDDGQTLWITFMKNCLYWGFVEQSQVEIHQDGEGVWRRIKNGWRNTDINGCILSKDKLSGALTKLAAYRGTSCDVDDDVSDYVVRRIKGQKMPAVERALAASKVLCSSVIDLMRLLTPKDFELLIDLVFSTSGWRRISVVGGIQETLDIDMLLPSTGEKAFVQVKSRTTQKEFAEYVAKFGGRADLYSRMFYVYHTGDLSNPDDSRVILIGPDKLSERVVDAGLAGWLIEKVS